jgi:hypothetical protein
MDELKLHKWKKKFEFEIAGLQIEFDSFFMDKRLSDYYKLRLMNKQIISHWNLQIKTNNQKIQLTELRKLLIKPNLKIQSDVND